MNVGEKATTLPGGHVVPAGSFSIGDNATSIRYNGRSRMFNGTASVGDRVKIISYNGKKQVIAAKGEPTGCYWLSSLDSYNVGTGGTESTFTNCLGNHVTYPGNDDPHTLMGDGGWFIGKWPSIVDLSKGPYLITVYYKLVGYLPTYDFQSNMFEELDYIDPNRLFWWPGPNNEYWWSVILPNKIRIAVKTPTGGTGENAMGQIVGIKICYPY